MSVARRESIPVAKLLGDVAEQYALHPEADRITIETVCPRKDLQVCSDRPMLLRVLGNMVVNALEASHEGDTVRVSATERASSLVLSVWNSTPIPQTVARHIFHRSFSTKNGLGRGLGTYSMKLLGEACLGGKVDFTSSPDAGTEFRLVVPLH